MGKKSYHLPENYGLQDYIITKVLGEGGFGIVYHAKDNKLNREVAIKEYYPHISVSRDEGYTVEAKSNFEDSYEEGLEKFIAEARVLASCEHPSIIKVHSIVEANNTAYMVMPYYQGITLEIHIRKNGRLKEEIVYHYLKPICEALNYLHQKGYIHRDVKPSNIFLRQHGETIEPILLDFGGARQFNTEFAGQYTQILTPGYAPPEQYLGKSKQAAYTDVYALAATFYHAVSGNVPPKASVRKEYGSNEEVAVDLELGGFSKGLANILEKSMALSASERYQSMVKFIDACQQIFEPSNTEQLSKREMAFQKKLLEEQRKRIQAEQKVKQAQQESVKVGGLSKHERHSEPRKNMGWFIWMLLSFLAVVISIIVVINVQSKKASNVEPIVPITPKQVTNQVSEGDSDSTQIIEDTEESEPESPTITTNQVSEEGSNSTQVIEETEEGEPESPTITTNQVSEEGSNSTQVIEETEESEPESPTSATNQVSEENSNSTQIIEDTEGTEEDENAIEETNESGELSARPTLTNPLEIVVSSNASWTPVKRDFDGTTMVLVPAGSFRMGSVAKEIDFALKLCNEVNSSENSGDCQRSWFEDETPPNTKKFDNPFWIDETEVTRGAYEACVSTGICTSTPDNQRSTNANQPINRITWHQAATYCKWRGARLPTEVEWEYAARGPDSFIFPWGNEFDGSRLYYFESSNNNTLPVGRYPNGASWVGALDMVGNVWEWTSSLYKDYPYPSNNGREFTGNKNSIREKIVRRSGSFDSDAHALRTTFRGWSNFSVDDEDYGLRCASSDSSSNRILSEEQALAEFTEVIVNNNSDWEPVKRDFDGTIMVLVPKGSFRMGSVEEEISFVLGLCGNGCQKSLYEDQTPTIIQTFDNPFWIDETEVTRNAYESCVAVSACTVAPDSDFSIGANQPVNRVTWHQAAAYCKWRGAKLPTEAEWEYAARGPDNLIFPWGNEFDENKVNYSQNSGNKTAPVGNYPNGISWVGALDMAGNVWEWTSSLYKDYPYINDDGRELSENKIHISENVVLRGGSFVLSGSDMHASNRDKYGADTDVYDIGFRCTRSNIGL